MGNIHENISVSNTTIYGGISKYNLSCWTLQLCTLHALYFVLLFHHVCKSIYGFLSPATEPIIGGNSQCKCKLCSHMTGCVLVLHTRHSVVYSWQAKTIAQKLSLQRIYRGWCARLVMYIHRSNSKNGRGRQRRLHNN